MEKLVWEKIFLKKEAVFYPDFYDKNGNFLGEGITNINHLEVIKIKKQNFSSYQWREKDIEIDELLIFGFTLRIL